METKTEKKKVSFTMMGVVTSTKADKTVTVNVERIFQHLVYKKIVRKKKKYLAHDNENKCKLGDVIRIKMVKPISKRKKWLVIDIISSTPEKAKDLLLTEEVVK